MPRPASLAWPRTRTRPLTWALVAAAVLVQIIYPLTPDGTRTPITVLSVLVFASASLTDVVRCHGPRGAGVLLLVAGGGGWLAEALGVHTGFPFGSYGYTGTLGPQLLGVPLVVPLAWVMMAWPALVVGRTLACRPATVAAVGAVALASWDVFLDPQMVDAGHWRWSAPEPGLPLVPGVPMTNYAGWLLVAAVMMALLNRALAPMVGTSGPAAALYLWTYSSSTFAHIAFFGLPGSGVVGGLVMGLVAVPFLRSLWRSGTFRFAASEPGIPGGAPRTRKEASP